MRPLVAHLGQGGADEPAFVALRSAFVARNPGHDVAWVPAAEVLDPCGDTRIAFAQGETVTVRTSAGEESEVGSGDVLVVRPGVGLFCESPIGLLVFTVPTAVDENVPWAIRPDWDPLITDTPGGCAEEENAYRRICLTWERDNGPYTYKELNAHRVRMHDSFSHYHPADDGFDEMYLVQEVRPGGHIVVSTRREEIEAPDQVARETVDGLLERLYPEAGDLVFIPRGVIHRGVGGVLAHVITVPGFRPGCEIGVDHHLRSIGERFGMTPSSEGLTWQASAARGPVVK